MRRILLTTVTLITTGVLVFGQNDLEKTASQIVAEGKRLYKCEMASWHGTDILLKKFPEQRDKMGGYFSYIKKDSVHCAFFSRDTTPSVITTISFDSTLKKNSAVIDQSERTFTEYERKLHTIRQKALKEVNSDTLFKVYENTNLNLVPLIDGNEKKVYVLTAPKNTGVVIFGNDYLVTFDENNEIKSKEKIHNNIIVTEYNKAQKPDKNMVGAMHTHLPSTGHLITPTDICTLMLYAKYANWKHYVVASDKYVSIWRCESNNLITVSKNEWDKWDRENLDQRLKKRKQK